MSSRQHRFSVRLDIEVRPCREADLPALEWFGAFTAHRQIIHDAFAQQQAGQGLMLLATAGGFPIGQVWIDFAKAGAQRTAVLWAVRVFDFMRGHGIGTRLVRLAELAAARRGMTHCELGVEKNNLRARRLYSRLGYRCVGELVETTRYVTPEGIEQQWTTEQWLMRRRLPTESRAGRSVSAGQSATSRSAATKR